MYDIAIVGAGPAGSTVARLLGDWYRVLLVDRRRLDSRPATGALKKTCGGLLAPAAQHELARQGLGVPARVVVGPQLFAVRTLDLDEGIERLYQRFYVNVDREEFDRWLVSLVPDRVDAGFGWRLTDLQPDPEGSFLRFTTAEGGQAGIRARLVIGADGASSLVRRLAYADTPVPRRYASLQAEYEPLSGDASYGAIFDKTLTDFYGWTIPKGDSLLVGAAFPAGPGVSARFETFVDRLRSSGTRLGKRTRLSSAMIVRPTNPLHLCPGGGGVLLVGEAAGFISPSSAEGISYALRSAAMLARALEPDLGGADVRYRLSALPLAFDVALKAAKSSAIYGATTRRLIMRSGLGAMTTRESLSAVPAARFAR